MPHGMCFGWDSTLIWVHTTSDIITALSYFVIPTLIIKFVWHKRDIDNKHIIIAFAAFITACGITHLIDIITIWVPVYSLQGAVKVVTALISLGTVLILAPKVPALLALPSLKELMSLNQRLAEANKLNQQILASAQEGIIVYDTEGRLQVWNLFMESITGFSKDACLGRKLGEIFPFLKGTVVLDGLERALQGKTVRNNSYPWILPRTGRSGWSYSVQAPLRRDDGQIVGVIETVSDITELKRAEEAVQLAALVFENSSEGMIVTDSNGTIISVNPAFTALTGYKSSEVIGKNPSILRSGRQDRAFYQAMWHSLTTTGHWEGEIWNRHKNGEIYAEWLAINTIRNADGSAHRRVALFLDITERKLSEELIWRQANFCSLTGLPNRRMFRDRLDQAIKKSDRASAPMALMFIDLDRFKEVNDSLGHEIGDVLLKEAAQRLVGCVRETDTVARLGGDEFTIIIDELHDPDNIERVLQGILTKMSAPFTFGTDIAYVTASIGITVYPDDGGNSDDLLKNADQAMYSAKNYGRNCYRYFNTFLKDTAQSRMKLVTDLHGALADGQFRVYYQPIIDMETGEVEKAEALVRWQHPKRGLIMPCDFIPLAEESGIVVELGAWVLRTACAQNMLWRSQGLAPLRITVNVSARQFQGENFPKLVREVLEETGLPPEALELEITEGMLMTNMEHSIAILEDLRAIGVQISEDDFGTGYSSLSYLKQFPIHTLKIDQSFVRDLATDPNDAALVSAIIAMARSLHLSIIAEGVETEEQLSMLRAEGCTQCQGFLFAKAMPEPEFADYLALPRRVLPARGMPYSAGT